MRLKELKRSATVAWSPSPSTPSYLATGTIAGAIDDSFNINGTIEIHDTSLNEVRGNLTMAQKGSASCSDRFHRITWGTYGIDTGSHPMGLLAGGLVDGSVHVWNPAAMIAGAADSEVVRVKKHQGPVKALEFNPHQPYLLASGGIDSHIMIWDLSNPISPKVFTPKDDSRPASEISCVGWNRKVSYILASGSVNGTATVWDLKMQRPVITFGDSHSHVRCSSLAWNPDVATQVVVASEDDAAPTLQVWDLRNANSPVNTLRGHTKGVLSCSWCPNDTNLLLSCGKDGRALCWNPNTAELLAELVTSGQWIYDIQWSPRIPDVLATASFDGKVTVHSLQDGGHDEAVDDSITSESDFSAIVAQGQRKTQKGLTAPPRWLQRPCGATFGFGGKLICFNAVRPTIVHVVTIGTDHQLATRVSTFHDVLNGGGDVTAYCLEKQSQLSSSDAQEVLTWKFLRVLFDEIPRRKIMTLLGFTDAECVGVCGVSVAAMTATASMAGAHHSVDTSLDTELNALVISSETSSIDNALLCRLLTVGNFSAAVKLCIKANDFAAALLIGSAGGPDLARAVQRLYLRQQHLPAMRQMLALIDGDLSSIINACDTSVGSNGWQMALATLCTYASDDTFSTLCCQLGNKLEQAGDTSSAMLCYMCGGDVDAVVAAWVAYYEMGDKSDQRLISLIEKTALLEKAVGRSSVNATIPSYFGRYARMLASNCLLQPAMFYLSKMSEAGVTTTSDESLCELADRVYHSLPERWAALYAVPAYPWTPQGVFPQPVYETDAQYNIQYDTQASYDQQQQAAYDYNQYAQSASAVSQIPQQSPQHPPQQPSQHPQRQPDPAPPASTYHDPDFSQFAKYAQYSAAGSTAMPGYHAPQVPVSANPSTAASPIASSYFNAASPATPGNTGNAAAGGGRGGNTVSTPVTPAPAVVSYPPEYAAAAQSLQQALLLCTTDPANKALKHKYDDMCAKLAILLKKLASGHITKPVGEKLIALCQALDARDYKAAKDQHVKLTSHHYSDCSEWLLGVQRLIDVLKGTK